MYLLSSFRGRRPRTILFILPAYSHFLPLFLHLSKEWRCGSLSVFNGHLPGEPGLACVHWSKKIMEVLVTTGAISRAKLQWNHHHQQTSTQFLTGRMPFLSPNQQCQSTEGISANQSRFWGIIQEMCNTKCVSVYFYSALTLWESVRNYIRPVKISHQQSRKFFFGRLRWTWPSLTCCDRSNNRPV